ncbi:S-adenosyl-L-methionine-dependent methyltransferase [Polychaeton citri CBS 116435]|uniref:S-adenosyl-L-methionine-dependent methyltransferase n=1 Tax=Polychaeton citri CBS 116435 TaxID=1314669 RepID=A0A9P4Q4W2_9PEZI|nr:S-adenosyl-L-methionine-dependent methyltransferase [Polychaeton citri CBS 116435]
MLKQHFLRYADDRINIRPLTAISPKRVLDVGCGSGGWAVEIAMEYPQASVVAIDLVDAIPTKPPNLHWKILNFDQPQWGLEEGSFDLIHLGHLCGSVSNWDRLFSKCFRYLAPGGHLEIIEMDWEPRCEDGSLPPNSPMHQWWEYMKASTTARPIAYRHDTGEMLEQAGFVQVSHLGPNRVPFNDWPEKIKSANVTKDHEAAVLGINHCCNMTGGTSLCTSTATSNNNQSRGFEALTMRPFTQKLGWQPTQVWDFLKSVDTCMKKQKHHGYHDLHIWTARKPAANGTPL